MRRRWQAAVDGAATASLVVAGAALVGLAVVQAWQVFARYLLNASPSWTEPVALLLMSTIMMFGAAVGVHREAHFGFFLLIETASPRVRRALRVYTRLVAVGIGLLLAIRGGQMFMDGWDVRLPGAPLPQGMVFLPLCLGGALIALFAADRILVERDLLLAGPATSQSAPGAPAPRESARTPTSHTPESPPARG